jgi:hypothetical protein
MQNYVLTHELVHHRHADLHRQAADARIAARGSADGELSYGGRSGHGPRRHLARRRLGLLLQAWGSRLAPVTPSDTPC